MNFRKRYLYFGIFRIDTYPFKNWVVNTFKPKYKWNMYTYLYWNKGKVFRINESNYFSENYSDFSCIGRYNNIFYFRKPKIEKEK